MALLRYLAREAVFLLIALVAVTYLIVTITNLGGDLDVYLTAQIRFTVEEELNEDEEFLSLPPEEQARLIEEEVQRRIEMRGLNLHPLPKSFIQAFQALTFSLGEAFTLTSSHGSTNIVDIVLERLPATLLLFTTAMLIAAFAGIWLGLLMAKRSRWRTEREWPLLSISLLVVPSWMLAIFLGYALSYGLRIFPPGGMLSVPAPTDPLLYAWDLMRHLALPMLVLALSSIGFWMFITRNIVLKRAHEARLRAARAKDPIDRRALLKEGRRAAYPSIIDYAALPLIAAWGGSIITELVFNWPGIGTLIWSSVWVFDPFVLIALTVTYTMLFVLTMFALKLARGVLDARFPRSE
ncbi:MAG: ABC transporter permease [Thermoplasmata archaeon]